MISLIVQMAPPTRNNPDGSGSSQDPMLQILQMLVADREADRTERQANIAAMHQIAQMANNNQGYARSNCPSVWTKCEQDQAHSLLLLSKTWPYGKANNHATTSGAEPLCCLPWIHAVQEPQGIGQRPCHMPTISTVLMKTNNPPFRRKSSISRSL